jgi:protein-L-isoaspartate(D-aspartate) O-methyltransferase
MKDHNNYTMDAVKNNIRSQNVIDENVLNAISVVQRSEYLPENYKSFANVDIDIPIAHGQKMLTPSVEAKIMQSLTIKKDENILVLGSGTGYLASCASLLCNKVHGIDYYEDFVKLSLQNKDKFSFKNLSFEKKDISSNWKIIGKFDVLIFTFSIESIDIIISNMSKNSRAFAFLGNNNSPIKSGVIIKKTDDSSYTTEHILQTSIAPIIQNDA